MNKEPNLKRISPCQLYKLEREFGAKNPSLSVSKSLAPIVKMFLKSKMQLDPHKSYSAATELYERFHVKNRVCTAIL